MVKRFLAKLILEKGSKILNSVFAAYKDVTKGGKTTDESKDPMNKFKFSNLMYTPMTKEEAIKILNLNKDELDSKVIMEVNNYNSICIYKSVYRNLKNIMK